MIIISIIVFILGTSLPVVKDSFSSVALARLSSILLLFCSLLTINTLDFSNIDSGIFLFNGLLKITSINQFLAIFLFLISSIILISVFPANSLDFNFKPIKNTVLHNSINSTLPISSMQGLGSNEGKSETDLAFQAQQAYKAQQALSLFFRSLKIKKNENYSPDWVKNYYLIVLFNILGASILILTSDLLTMFVAVELQSFSLYILATLNKESLFSTSAGLKYFLIGSLASSLILLGIAIIYLETGITQFESLYLYLTVPMRLDVDYSDYIYQLDFWREVYTIFGFASETLNLAFILIFCGLFIKLGAAPFHQWSPDVYDRVPTKVTSWLVIIPKLTILIFIFELLDLVYSETFKMIFLKDFQKDIIYMSNNYFVEILDYLKSSYLEGFTFTTYLSALGYDVQYYWYITHKPSLYELDNVYSFNDVIRNFLLISSFLSLIIGAVLGLNQIKIKRLLAYSGINHLGFLILALALNTKSGVESFLFYLIQYTLTTLNVFLIILAFGYIASYKFPSSTVSAFGKSMQGVGISQRSEQKSPDSDFNYIKQFTGLFKDNPLLSISLAVCLFSMAGVPPLLGFFGKQQILYASISQNYTFISIVAIVMSVISAYYYLNIIKISHFNTYPDSKVTADTERDNFNNKRQFLLGPASSSINATKKVLQNTHSYAIAVLTLIIIFFFIKPTFIFKSLIAVSYYIFFL